MKRKPKRIKLSRETLHHLGQPRLGAVAGGLIASENPENPCEFSAGGTCGEYTCQWSCPFWAC